MVYITIFDIAIDAFEKGRVEMDSQYAEKITGCTGDCGSMDCHESYGSQYMERY